MMILGKWLPMGPTAEYIPQFENLKVLVCS